MTQVIHHAATTEQYPFRLPGYLRRAGDRIIIVLDKLARVPDNPVDVSPVIVFKTLLHRHRHRHHRGLASGVSHRQPVIMGLADHPSPTVPRRVRQ
ncbi:hypothetical protein [Xenorhabdus sp. IM139775]|uniref:hypothetical protein n=1 Tax=Xenorhabdus sp. IM139775 TaxID=3025876 RepID=UPI002359C33E|nr:hypothetical protein [Xenorhabdus sp. IM139775]MDC9592523.1 hypothetical protein [Xenorhabdus sp. IM139775]